MSRLAEVKAGKELGQMEREMVRGDVKLPENPVEIGIEKMPADGLFGAIALGLVQGLLKSRKKQREEEKRTVSVMESQKNER